MSAHPEYCQADGCQTLDCAECEEVVPEPSAPDRLRLLESKYWLSGGDLIRPVSIQIRADGDDAFVASEPSTRIFGAGDTAAAAVRDLRAALAEHLAVLDRSERLSADLAERRDFLRSHLSRA